MAKGKNPHRLAFGARVGVVDTEENPEPRRLVFGVRAGVVDREKKQ